MAQGKACQSCGMLMLDLADFAAQNRRSPYCKYCTTPDGMLQSPQERLSKLTAFLMEDERLAEDKAREQAIARMRKMPAWKGKI